MQTQTSMRTWLLTMLVIAQVALPCAADFVIIIEHEQVSPGGTVEVGVYATSSAGHNISGFNLPLDVGADGKETLPNGFTFRDPIIRNALFSNTGYDVPEPQITIVDVDAIPSGFVPAIQAVTLSNVPTKLFDLVFDVGPAVPIGTVIPLRIVSDPLGLFNITSPSLAVATNPPLGEVARGSITVVPEPSSVGFLLFVAVTNLAVVNSRRQRRTSSST
jgi:hypothetical protein